MGRASHRSSCGSVDKHTNSNLASHPQFNTDPIAGYYDLWKEKPLSIFLHEQDVLAINMYKIIFVQYPDTKSRELLI